MEEKKVYTPELGLERGVECEVSEPKIIGTGVTTEQETVVGKVDPMAITPEDATKIHATLAKEDDEEIDYDKVREELDSEGTEATARVNINPLTGEQVGEPELSDEDVRELIFDALNGEQGLSEEYKEALTVRLDITIEQVEELEKFVIGLDRAKDVREQVDIETLNKYIPDIAVAVDEDVTDIIEAKYKYLAALKEVCLFDISKLSGEAFDKIILAAKEKAGVSPEQLAEAAAETLKAKIAHMEETGKSLYEINKYKAKLKVTTEKELSLNNVDELLKGRAKYLSRDFMSNRALQKELIKFEGNLNKSIHRIDSLEYFSAAIDAAVLNTTGDRLSIIEIRKFLYMLIRACNTRTSELDLSVLTIGWLVKSLYTHVYSINTDIEDGKDIKEKDIVYGKELYAIIKKYI